MKAYAPPFNRKINGRKVQLSDIKYYAKSRRVKVPEYELGELNELNEPFCANQGNSSKVPFTWKQEEFYSFCFILQDLQKWKTFRIKKVNRIIRIFDKSENDRI